MIRESLKNNSDKQLFDEEDMENFDPNHESRVGKKLSDLTTKRVIILVLVLIIFIPFFSLDYWSDSTFSFQSIIDQMTTYLKYLNNGISASEFQEMCSNYIDYNEALERYPLTFFESGPCLNQTFGSSNYGDILRKDEFKEFSNSFNSTCWIHAVIDISRDSQENAIINICRTIYISIVLTIGGLLFSKDANNLALRPIERMIEKVNKIAKNPLKSKEVAMVKENDKSQYETTFIENAIIKIGTLLALGFGDAGSEIIAQNIAQGGDVNPMIPGKRSWAVFGFCDIRNFTDSTEVLQEEVMVFVNIIGNYVHKIVDKYCGAANKNIGDAFLLVWKVDNSELETINGVLQPIQKSQKIKNTSDFSLISFLKVIIAINKKAPILKYRENVKLNNLIPNYKVKMGFGLHFGWAIEGAIGSIYKIDASYLSPNVNMASRLEAATKQYGVHLLISDELQKRFSKKVRKMTREIDRVTVKGSIKPISLFTLDLDLSKIEPSEAKFEPRKEQEKRHKEAKEEIFFNYVDSFFL